MTSLGSGTWRRAGSDRGALLAAGGTDPGIQREVNEDRFHVDAARGLFVVIDGVGGQAAGGRAADVALSLVRERLERETGPVGDRIREAITVANNEVHRLASTRAEWKGMACVLTIAVVNDGKATIGHVGDTRLYRIRDGHMEKITRDHSPVGEREDAGELSESQAMRHPRRNEVYRDVGSEPHAPGDADFIESDEIPFEPDAALLLCTDGLTDLVDSTAIARIVGQLAGDPEAIVAALIAAANAAGGKDNVTVVYVEGEQFASRQAALAPTSRRRTAGTAQPVRACAAVAQPPGTVPRQRSRRPFVALAIAALVIAATATAAIGLGLVRTDGPLISRLWPLSGFRLPWFERASASLTPALGPADVQVVQPTGSIADAIRDAAAESEIVVEPGEYREQLVLKEGVRLVSRVPRGAIIRLPATAPDSASVPAILATGLSKAELVGFRIVGDSATPLAVGIRVEGSALSIVDVEITGATKTAIEFSGGGAASLVASDIRDNPGPAIVVHDGATPRIAHNAFARNGTSERAGGTIVLTKRAGPRFISNVFVGLSADSFVTLDNSARLALKNENWFVPVSGRRAGRGPAPNRPQRNK